MPLAIDDVLAIQQVAARYNHAVDSGDGDAFAATFVEDGVLINTMRVEGRDALAAFAKTIPDMIPKPRHVATNLVIDGDGDNATLKAYLQLVARPDAAAPAQILASGVYDDTLRRENGQWLFVERNFTAD